MKEWIIAYADYAYRCAHSILLSTAWFASDKDPEVIDQRARISMMVFYYPPMFFIAYLVGGVSLVTHLAHNKWKLVGALAIFGIIATAAYKRTNYRARVSAKPRIPALLAWAVYLAVVLSAVFGGFAALHLSKVVF